MYITKKKTYLKKHQVRSVMHEEIIRLFTLPKSLKLHESHIRFTSLQY